MNKVTLIGRLNKQFIKPFKLSGILINHLNTVTKKDQAVRKTFEYRSPFK